MVPESAAMPSSARGKSPLVKRNDQRRKAILPNSLSSISPNQKLVLRKPSIWVQAIFNGIGADIEKTESI